MVRAMPWSVVSRVLLHERDGGALYQRDQSGGLVLVGTGRIRLVYVCKEERLIYDNFPVQELPPPEYQETRCHHGHSRREIV